MFLRVCVCVCEMHLSSVVGVTKVKCVGSLGLPPPPDSHVLTAQGSCQFIVKCPTIMLIKYHASSFSSESGLNFSGSVCVCGFSEPLAHPCYHAASSINERNYYLYLKMITFLLEPNEVDSNDHM